MYLSCMAMPESPGQELMACCEMAMWVRGAPRVARAGFPARPGGAGVLPACLLVRKGFGFYPALVLLNKKSLLVAERSAAACGCL